MGDLKDTEKQGSTKHESVARHLAITYGCVLLWVFLSTFVIMTNKYVLAYAAFPFPVALTLTHMAFCSTLAMLLIRLGVCEAPAMEKGQYLRNIVPIAALFSGTLWLGNAAYMYLSVSFIQMLKAAMPVTVFVVGVFLGTEKYSHSTALCLLVVSVGVGAASFGELAFNLIGVVLQSGSIATESFRLSLIQILLHSRGIKLNPITTLSLVAPACFVFLLIPFSILELPLMRSSETWRFNAPLLLLSAAGAFALNLSVFLLIGRSSALTMNVAGVLKDWLLIGLSVMIFKSAVTPLQLVGYTVALAGVAWFNYQKMQFLKGAPAAGKALPSSASAKLSSSSLASPEREPLLDGADPAREATHTHSQARLKRESSDC